MKYYLYNPKANNAQEPEFLGEIEYKSVIGMDFQKFFDELKAEDEVVLIGGDGTLNYFVNAVDIDSIRNNVYLLPAGTGNDFMNDMNSSAGEEILLNECIKNLPVVYVNGIEKKFINGIGFGIDGYCCEVADKIIEKEPGKKINYTGIAIKGLLFHFKKKTAKIKVDGKEYCFRNAWLAPSMKGRFYGGGMMIAPEQDRMNGELSCVVYHTGSKLKALMAFPDIFKGTHVKRTDMVSIFTGKEIEVEFDEPCALQIDGDTVLDVKSYKVKA